MLEGKRISELDLITNLRTGCCFPVLSDGATKRVSYGSLLSEIENDLPETGIEQVKEDVAKLKTKTAKIDTLENEVDNLGNRVADVDETISGQNATIRNCVSTVESLQQVIETTHFDDVLELENDVRANTTNITGVNEKIPAQASASNKLVDKASLNKKLDNTTDVENAGKAVIVDEDGNLVFGAAGVQVSQEEGNAIEEKEDGIFVPSGLSGVPIGTIVSWSSNNVPAGFLKFDGTTYNKSDYPVLYTRIPDEWKIDENTFKLPDLKDKFIQGANNNLGTEIEAGLPNITGFINATSRSDQAEGRGAFTMRKVSGWYPQGSTSEKAVFDFDAANGETKSDGTLKNDVYGKSDTVQPPAIALHFIIKATDYSQATEDVIDDTRITTGNVWSAAKTAEEIGEVENKSIYSENETICGTWIDGKPIYRRVYKGLNLSAGSSWTYTNLDGLNNIETLVKGTCYRGLDSTDSNKNIVLNCVNVWVTSDKRLGIWASPTQTAISVIVLEYTKTN